MSLSNSMTLTARRLLLKYGQSISFSRVVEGAFIPSTGAVAAGTTTSYTAYGSLSTPSNTEINGTTILQGDLMLYLEKNSAGYIPAIGDVATVSGVAYRVIHANSYVAQGSAVMYKLQIRI